MRISLIDRFGVGNAGAIANASRAMTRRRREDEEMERLSAALSRRDRARTADPLTGATRPIEPARRAS